MDKNKLTMDILEKLSLKITKGSYPGMEARKSGFDTQIHRPKNNNKLLFVFTGSNVSLNESIKEIEKLRDLGYTIDIALSESAENMFGKEIYKSLLPRNIYTESDKMNYIDMVQNIDAIIVPVATQNTGVKLTLGIQDSFISMLLWQCLWQDKNLYMNFDDMTNHRGIESKSKMLLQMMNGYIDKLKRLGVKPVSIINLSDTIHKSFTSDKSLDLNAENITTQRRIITEKDVLNMSPGETVTVSMRTIITSLAEETAKNLSIKIVKQNG